MQEQYLLETALHKLEQHTGLRTAILGWQNQVGKQRYDALVQITTQQEPSIKQVLKTEIKKNPQSILVKSKYDFELLIGDYINPVLGQALREQQCNYLDSVGNAYLNRPPLFISIQGHKPPLSSSTKVERLFQVAGLKLIFALLTEPTLLQANYRTLSTQADIALGAVGTVLKDLEQHGFLIKQNKERVLINKADLIQQWVSHYATRLRPKFSLGFYKTTQPLSSLELKIWQAYWSGEVAAQYLVNYLQPMQGVVYLKDNPNKFILMNGLLACSPQEANIELIQSFWEIDTSTPTRLVNPLLIYADLLASDHPRNLEVAKLIYEQYLI